MKNRISLSGMANDVRRLGRPVRRVLAVFVVACVVVLLLAAGSPPLQAQARTAPEDEQAFHRLVVGQRMINADDLSILTAQNWTEMSDPVRPYVTRLTDGNSLSCGLATQEEMASIREAIDRMPQGLTPSGKHALAPPAANISVNYTGFTPEAQAAFQRAVDIWSSLLIATVPIEIEANFDSLENSDALAAARPSTWFCSTTVCAPVGLVNQVVDEDRKPDDPDIETTFSSSDDWYFELDGQPGEGQHDFVSVALHEIGHGLGFYDSFRIDESTEEVEYGLGDDNIPTIFDSRIFDTEINRLVDEDEYTNPSTELTDAITGITLFWGGLKTLTANGGFYPVLLWAPEDFDRGSSVAHLDEWAYPPGTPNVLMTPSLNRGEAEASLGVGPLMLAMLGDMGWTMRDQTLQVPHFGVGGGFSSDVVVTNRSSTETAAVAIDVWDPEGNALDGNLILGVGADRFDLSPSGSRTLTLSHDGSDLLTGSITVSSDTPVSAVVRFDLQGTGITGVGTSPRLRAAIAPVRRSGNLSSGVAIRNPELAAQTIDLELKDEDGLVVPGGEASRTIEGGGRIAAFIEDFFPEAVTTDFKGEITIRARAGQIAVIVLELEVGRAFTTLPVSPIVVSPRPTTTAPPPDRDPTPPPPPSPTKPFNQLQTERLIGTWEFSYTLISEFTNTYKLNDVRENSSTPGEWHIFGTDEFGDLVIAGYSPDLGMFTLLNPGTLIHQFFTFDFVGSNTVSGCYYQVDVADDSFSRCYDMTGVRTSSTALTSLTTARPSTTAAQAELAEIREAERLRNEVQIEIDPKIIKVLKDLRESLPQ